MERLLRLLIRGDEDDGAMGKFAVQPRGHKGVTRARKTVPCQRAARLHAPQEALSSGSLAKPDKELIEHEADGLNQRWQAGIRTPSASRTAQNPAENPTF